MRFLLKEQAYEKLISRGKFRYERDGQPTGAIEHWRLTQALEGYRFLRVDLDTRATAGSSFLFNLLINSDGQAENLRYRYYEQGPAAETNRVQGQIISENGTLTSYRDVNGQRFESELPNLPILWFPSTAGLQFLLATTNFSSQQNIETMTVHFNSDDNPADYFRPIVRTLTTQPITAEAHQSAWQISWENSYRQLWLDEMNAVQRMRRDDGLTAIPFR